MDLGKADFDSIYDRPDARAYYSTLGALDYEIPQHGANIFATLIDECFPEERPTLLDVCCSYGASGVLLKTDLNLNDVCRHYEKVTAEQLSTDTLRRVDTELLAEHRVADAPVVVGLDVAPNAIEYAVATHALDAGFAENLEDGEPSPELASRLREVDMITTTGGIGYVTEKTISRLVDAADTPPIVAAFCLRAYDYRPIADALAERGLITEKADRAFPQRRFADAEEREWALAQVRANDHDPGELESDGRYYAEFFLSRPAAAVADRPLPDLLPALAG